MFWNKLYFNYFQQYPWNLRDNYEPPGSTCAEPQKVSPPCPSRGSDVDLRSGPWHSFEPENNDKIGLELKEKVIEVKKKTCTCTYNPVQAELLTTDVKPLHISNCKIG